MTAAPAEVIRSGSTEELEQFLATVIDTNGEEEEEDAPARVNLKSRHLLVKLIRSLIHKAHAKRWREQELQGIYASATMGVGRESTYYLRSGENMRPPVYKFIHAARLNSSKKLNFQPQNEKVNRICRRGCKQKNNPEIPAAETIGHVISECLTHSAILQLRHNRVLMHLKNAAVANGWSVLYEDQAVGGRRRPDLIMVRGHQAVCIDAAVKTATIGKLEEKYAEKAAKYQEEVRPVLLARNFRRSSSYHLW